MKIGFTTLACPKWDLDQVIARAKEYGYDGVDFRGLMGEMAVYKLPEFSADISKTVARFAKAKLEVCGFSSGARLYEKDPAKLAGALGEVSQYARLCGFFHTPFIRVFGGALPPGPRDEAVADAVQTLETMAQIAAPAIIALEAHDDWVDSSLLAQAMRRVKAPNACVLWDVHHPFRMRGETPRQTWDNIGPYVRYTHVKDSRALPDGQYQYTLPGEGDVPLAEMIALMKSGRYDGYLVAEWEKKWHPELAEPQIALPAFAAYLRRFTGSTP
jgi:fatty-acyl-CoA synthase